MEGVDFFDIVILEKIKADPESSVEGFGQKINTSFFEAANILGTLKVKGLISFEQSIGGQSKLELSSQGTWTLNLAEEKKESHLSKLDDRIMYVISEGVSDLASLHKEVNVTTEDIALHLYKLVKKGYVEYYIRSGKLYVLLTEKGFSRVGSILPDKPDTAEAGAGGLEAAASAGGEGSESSGDDAKYLVEPEIPVEISAGITLEHKGDDEPPFEGGPDNAQGHEKANPADEDIKKRRMFSKAGHYLKKYGPLIIVILIFIFAMAYYFLGK